MNPELSVAATLASDYCATLHAGHPHSVCSASLSCPIGVRLQGSGILLGGQDCHQSASGAHTGDVSTAMLRDCGVSLVLLGHSERRADHGETSELVAAKAVQAFETGLSVMICVGETLAEREAGNALATVLDQLAISVPTTLSTTALTIAYEPVWAIGTGKVATAVEIAEMHLGIRRWLDEAGFAQTEILYGGSVKPGNAGRNLCCAACRWRPYRRCQSGWADFAGICAAAAG